MNQSLFSRCQALEIQELKQAAALSNQESEAKIARLAAENAGLVVEKEAKAAELQAKVWCLQFLLLFVLLVVLIFLPECQDSGARRGCRLENRRAAREDCRDWA